METQVRTPQTIFMQPQRLVVPLFQRPYVWNQENQWEPMWNDVARLAGRLLGNPTGKHPPHFLGAVVLQQVQNLAGTMQQRTIIDGQQRLTTLQLLFDALHAELIGVQALAPALRIESLIVNADPFCRSPEDKFKVWPTNRDRQAFNAVMGAPPPVDYQSIGHKGERMVLAHRYFSTQAKEWLDKEGPEQRQRRADAIELIVREFLQMVVIDLGADENAQEIFETLNARGAQLTAADLIKNFIFQRLLENGADVELAYDEHWKDFETAFWETEVSVGRLRFPRSSIFLNHWLVAETGEEVVAREVFTRFKRYALEAAQPMEELLPKIHLAASVYRQFIEDGAEAFGPIEKLGLFSYRTGVLESEVVKPLILFLLDPKRQTVPNEQLQKSLACIESWMVRRMLVRATTKSYNRVIADLVTQLSHDERSRAGDLIEDFLKEQKGESQYWPDDQEVRNELRTLPVYKRLRRGRLRMVLEAIEDYKRGWCEERRNFNIERIPRGRFAIEHVLPRNWSRYWPLPNDSSESDRDGLIHTLGNLTLLTSGLNSSVSNGPWLGEGGKRQGLEGHDVLILNRELLRLGENEWTHLHIRSRTDELTDCILKIWPAPPGHRSGFGHISIRQPQSIDLADLISADFLQPGVSLYPRQSRYSQNVGTLLSDGRIDIQGVIYATPSEAARSITGGAMNGWWFFLVNQSPKRSLKDVRKDYVESLATDSDEEDADEEADDEV